MRKLNIAVIYCGYNQLDNVRSTLTFWNNLKLHNANFTVNVISVPFLEYKNIPVVLDGTEEFITSLKKSNIDKVLLEPKYVIEAVARTKCLESFDTKDIDFFWQVDSDEYYTESDVVNILNYLQSTPHVSYALNFKNYIFDGKHYLDDCLGTKINRVRGYKLASFVDDTQISYLGIGLVKPHTIPKDVAWIKHITWLHKDGKQKVEYQLKHFGDCSYRWNSDKNELEIDFDYYRRYGYTVPNVLKDNE